VSHVSKSRLGCALRRWRCDVPGVRAGGARAAERLGCADPVV